MLFQCRSTKQGGANMTTYRKLGATLALAVAVDLRFHRPMPGMDEAKRWIEKEFQPSTLTKEQQLKEMEWFVNAAKPFKGLEINVLSETIPTHEYEAKVLTKAFRGDHRDQGESPAARRRRGRPGRADADADQPESLRRLHQRLGSDRDALATAVGGQSDRLDGGRRQGRHAADAGRQRLHRQVVHHRAGRQALAAAGPAVRQPVLVPLRLVQAAGAEEAVQGDLRLRAGGARSTGRPTRTSPSSSRCT